MVPVRNSPLFRAPESVLAPNGLSVISSRLATTPIVHAHLAVPLFVNGAADLAALDVMSATWTDSPACRELENLGGAIALTRRRHWLILSLTTPRHAMGAAFEVLRSVTQPVYTDEAVRNFAPRCRQQSVQIRSHPGALSSALMWRSIYGTVPTALEPAPDPSAVGGVDLSQVTQVHLRHIRPRGAYLVLVGDLDQTIATQAAVDALAAWTPGTEVVSVERAPAPMGPPTVLVHRRDSQPVNHVRLVAPSLPVSNPQAFSTSSIASLVLGGNFSARLNTIVRENRGLAYRTMTMLTDHGDDVVLTLEADVARDQCGAAMDLISEILDDLAAKGPTERELTDAVGFTIGSHELALGSQYGRSSCLISYLTLGLGLEAMERLPDNLTTMTNSEVRDVFRMFTPQSFWGVLSGPDGRSSARGEFRYE